MKMPGNQSTDNGIYNYEENTSYFSEGLDNNGIEEFSAPAENDFSEYLWMENEEEFDKEVMQRLEEEALMEECIEAFMNDENNSETPNSQQGKLDRKTAIHKKDCAGSFNMLHNINHVSCVTWGNNNKHNNRSSARSRSEPSPESVANSKLNPEAAEFVPSNRTPPEIPATATPAS